MLPGHGDEDLEEPLHCGIVRGPSVFAAGEVPVIKAIQLGRKLVLKDRFPLENNKGRHRQPSR